MSPSHVAAHRGTSTVRPRRLVKDGLAGLTFSLRSALPDTITSMTVSWGADPTNDTNAMRRVIAHD